MRQHLTKHGDDLALVIGQPLLDQIGADAASEFDITTDGRNIFVSPVRSAERRAAFEQVLENVTSRYAKTLKRLAE